MRRQLERDGYEQPLDLDGLLSNSLSVFFVENAFVGHVLIDDQQAPAVICDDIAVMDLPENPGSRQIEWTRSKFGGRSQQHVGPYAQTVVVLRILRRSRSFISEGIVESPLEWIGGRTGRREIKWCGFRSRPGGPGAPREIASRNRSLLPRIAAMHGRRLRFLEAISRGAPGPPGRLRNPHHLISRRPVRPPIHSNGLSTIPSEMKLRLLLSIRRTTTVCAYGPTCCWERPPNLLRVHSICREPGFSGRSMTAM